MIGEIIAGGHVRVDVVQAARFNVDDPQAQWCPHPFLQVVASEGDTQFSQAEIHLAQGMGAVEHDVDTGGPGLGGNGLHRHDQAGTMSDMGQGHQFQAWVAGEGVFVALQQAFVGGRVWVGDFDNFHAAVTHQPAHGVLDAVVFQVTDQDLVAGFQGVVVANQRLQRG
ncbi:hypothetical protein D3C80_831730 [compost metagenome]